VHPASGLWGRADVKSCDGAEHGFAQDFLSRGMDSDGCNSTKGSCLENKLLRETSSHAGFSVLVSPELLQVDRLRHCDTNVSLTSAYSTNPSTRFGISDGLAHDLLFLT
jgi:hypothetical protein